MGSHLTIPDATLSLEGSAHNIQDDHEVWILVKPDEDDNWYAVPVDREGDRWSLRTRLGEQRATPGAEFWVYLYDVDALGDSILEEAITQDIPEVVPLPDAQKLDSVFVTRQS